ncbi:hypothetical protein ACP4OV_027906 [Aristida adscensionis]
MAFFLPQPLIVTLALLVPLCLYMNHSRRTSKTPSPPTNWPVVGMLPALMYNLHNLQDYVAGVLAVTGGSCPANGPQASSMRFLFTCDPANIRHIFTTNIANYPKGEEFTEIFDIMRGSFTTVDGEPCRRQRRKIQGILSDPRMVSVMASSSRHKVAKGLVPFLAGMASTGAPFDLQDVIARLVFDLTAMPIFSVDPGLLSPDMPPADAPAAMDTVMEGALLRHTVPASCWQLMRRLNLGPERRLAAAHSVLHQFVADMIERRKAYRADLPDAAAAVDIMSSYIGDPDYDDSLLRATLNNYMIAGRDTIASSLPWFFYNLASNPHVVAGIRKELAAVVCSGKHASLVSDGTGGTAVIFEPEETKSLIYLQAALFESLRLYPPGPIERKTVVADDVMPSGHEVHAGDAILISLYALGRMVTVWGEDCHEYRPDRWLTDGGAKLRYVPSHKFLAFNSGPRMCLGKDIAIMHMKTIAAAVVWNFDMEVLEGQSMKPKMSCLLQMKNGLMVTVNRREECSLK